MSFLASWLVLLAFTFIPSTIFAEDIKPTPPPDASTSDSSLTNIAPYLLPGLIPEQGKWIKVVHFSGENGKNTAPFKITERRWRVAWTCKKINGTNSMALTVVAKPDDTKPNLQGVCATDRESADSTELRGAGSYFFAIESKCLWSLEVEQYVPSDVERVMQAEQDEHDQNWQVLGNYSGLGDRDTGTFTVTLKRWRVKWFSEPPSGWPDDSLNFHVAVYTQEGKLMSEVCNSPKAGHDIMEFSGLGNFYFKVSGQAKWNIIVQQTDK